MIYWFKNNLLWTAGLPILIVVVILAVLSFIFFKPFLYVLLGFLIFSLYFFRNPDRVCVEALKDKSILVCPSDGKVLNISYDKDNKFEGYPQRISIFLSPFDVHVNWTPMAGEVTEVKYCPGAFNIAYLPKSSELNERNDLLLTSENGKTILVRQIAGFIARRICCWVKRGEKVGTGHKYGMIRFGSRMDIFLPSDVTIDVGVGQRVYGGQTILGRWKKWQ